MTPGTGPDLSACRAWRASVAFGGAHVGIIPAWNALTLLNPAAALIWDLLAETRDRAATAKGYALGRPDRAAAAQADVAACIDAWDARGLFRKPEPSKEDALLATLSPRMPPAGRPAAFDRVLDVAGVPARVEIDDPDLAAIAGDMLVDVPDTARTPQRHLRVAGDGGLWVLGIDARPSRAATDRVMARGQLVAELVRLAAGDHGWRATIHGAVLSGPAGAVFLAGASGAGKTTLAAGLIASGWRMLAEDIAAFGPGWTVCPMPFALSIKEGAVPLLLPAYPGLANARIHPLGARRVRYQGLGPRGRATTPERPRIILDVGYSADHGDGPAAVERLTAIETLELFLNEESYIDFERDDPEGFLDFVGATPGWRIRYGTRAAAESAILEALARTPG